MKPTTMEDSLNSALEHYEKLIKEAKEEFQRTEMHYRARVAMLNTEISKIKDDLDLTKGDNYPADGLFYPKQN